MSLTPSTLLASAGHVCSGTIFDFWLFARPLTQVFLGKKPELVLPALRLAGLLPKLVRSGSYLFFSGILHGRASDTTVNCRGQGFVPLVR